MNDIAAIAVFAKAPIPSQVKTRLIPKLGPEGAAALQEQLIVSALRTACDAGLGPVSLWCAPDCRHPSFDDAAEKFPVTLYDQMGADLGERVLAVFKTLTGELPLLLMGCDCPGLTTALLVRCASILSVGNDAVFVPAEDGGYRLIGADRPLPVLFDTISWSTDQVMHETRLRARMAGLRIAETEALWDIDRPEDYDRALALGLVS